MEERYTTQGQTITVAERFTGGGGVDQEKKTAMTEFGGGDDAKKKRLGLKWAASIT